MKRLLLAAAVAVGVVVALAGSASAHPLGNFTINQFSGLHVGRDAIVIDLVTDMAEIPTYQVKGDIDTNGDGTFDAAELATWRGAQCVAQAGRAEASRSTAGRCGRSSTAPSPSASRPGQGGLPTLRLECPLRASIVRRGRRRTRSSTRITTSRDGSAGGRSSPSAKARPSARAMSVTWTSPTA